MRKLSSYEYNILQKYKFDFTKLYLYKDMPVEYIIGYAEFYNRNFVVNKNTLIPRIETEDIIDYVINFCKNYNLEYINILDLATGTGCIGITLYLELTKLNISVNKIVLSDISSKALEVTKQNIENHIATQSLQHFEVIKSDLLKNIKTETFDIVIANLPYIPTSRINNLPHNVKDYEPILALDGGPNGTTIINKLLKEMSIHQILPRLIVLEIDDSHILKDFKKDNKYSYKIIKDSNSRNRFLVGVQCEKYNTQ